MNIELRTDKNIQNSDRLITYVREELNQQFQRYSEKITHFSVHLSDENGDKKNTGEDIKCMIEASPAGLNPVVANYRSYNIDTAIHGAIDRLKNGLERAFEKNGNHRALQHAYKRDIGDVDKDFDEELD